MVGWAEEGFKVVAEPSSYLSECRKERGIRGKIERASGALTEEGNNISLSQLKESSLSGETGKRKKPARRYRD